MTRFEKGKSPLAVGDDVKTYDDGTDGHPEKMVEGTVTEIGDESFAVLWDDFKDNGWDTEYEWVNVTIEGNQIFEHGGINIPKITPLRRVLFVFRQKEWYDKNAIALWWKRSVGTGIIGKPKRQFKFFMIGVSVFNLRAWIDFKWVGYCKDKQRLKLKDS